MNKKYPTAIVLLAISCAAIAAGSAVWQLFDFVSFQLLMSELSLPGGAPTASVFASLIVTAEVFAIPFLLQMPLSNAMKFVSMVAGWLCIVNLYVVLWFATYVADSETIAMLTDPWAWAIGVALSGLVVLLSWRMWPLQQIRTK